MDEVVCLQTPDPFYAIGVFYRDFTQTSDEDVVDLLARFAQTKDSPGNSLSDRE